MSIIVYRFIMCSHVYHGLSRFIMFYLPISAPPGPSIGSQQLQVRLSFLEAPSPESALSQQRVASAMKSLNVWVSIHNPARNALAHSQRTGTPQSICSSCLLTRHQTSILHQIDDGK